MGFVLFMPRFGDAAERGTREQLWYFIGTVAPGWLVWQTSSIVGIYLGTMVPATVAGFRRRAGAAGHHRAVGQFQAHAGVDAGGRTGRLGRQTLPLRLGRQRP